MNKCLKPECNAAGNLCLDGKPDPTECEYYQKEECNDSRNLNQNGQNLPWSGNDLGPLDLELLKAKNSKIIIGIIGSHDTGKTTFLMMLYLQLMKGINLSKFTFSNSLTLNRWEVLASWGREHNYLPATFPPHTSRNSLGETGLLHIGMRDELESCVDILLTDAPGEWFSAWAINEDAPNAQGAKWVIENSDIYILIADCQKLLGTDRGNTKKEILDLITRLTISAQNKPFLLLWTKTDSAKKSDLLPSIVETITKRINSSIPHAIEFEINIVDQSTVVNAMNALLDKFEQMQHLDDISKSVLEYQSPFYAFKTKFV